LSVSWVAGVSSLFHGLTFTGKGGGGNWITLDFRGLIFWTYITLLAIHVVVRSIASLRISQGGALRIHLGSMVLSLILLVARDSSLTENCCAIGLYPVNNEL
jgi:hypothetical protein